MRTSFHQCAGDDRAGDDVAGNRGDILVFPIQTCQVAQPVNGHAAVYSELVVIMALELLALQAELI
jgi:hypothetical protein